MCIPFGKTFSLGPRSRSSVIVRVKQKGHYGNIGVSQTHLVFHLQNTFNLEKSEYLKKDYYYETLNAFLFYSVFIEDFFSFYFVFLHYLCKYRMTIFKPIKK